MISISADYESRHLVHLVVSGHGGLEYGKDVVCAGVSCCVIGALNALTSCENYSIEIGSGFMELKRRNPSTDHDEVVLETLIVQLGTISQKFPDRVRIKVSRKEGKK